ncbi:MAG: hotdog fold thioesterase [Salibacteraceae bacterium]
MSIWHKTPTLDQINAMRRGTLLETLDIRFTEIGDDYLAGDMPVDHRTIQTYGILHGGASVALAETLGSVAAHLAADNDRYFTVGMEINANHLRPATHGRVSGIAKPIHIGHSTQVWSIEIKNDDGKLVCISRLTMAVVPKEKVDNRKAFKS